MSYKLVKTKDYPVTQDMHRTVTALRAFGGMLGALDVLEAVVDHPSIADARQLLKCIADDIFGESDSLNSANVLKDGADIG